jgi:hypothetical protein
LRMQAGREYRCAGEMEQETIHSLTANVSARVAQLVPAAEIH